MTPELRSSTATHILDLVALSLGATRDGAAIANGRGMRAARLHAAKADILEHLGSPELSVAVVARRQRVTPRYIHLLFEAEGMTFSEYVLSQRLTRAYRILSNPRFNDQNISTVAFSVGFGDLSYFNRTFRQRFRATPTDVRLASALDLQSPARHLFLSDDGSDATVHRHEWRDGAEGSGPIPPRRKK